MRLVVVTVVRVDGIRKFADAVRLKGVYNSWWKLW